jgi:hypothetical protein
MLLNYECAYTSSLIQVRGNEKQPSYTLPRRKSLCNSHKPALLEDTRQFYQKWRSNCLRRKPIMATKFTVCQHFWMGDAKSFIITLDSLKNDLWNMLTRSRVRHCHSNTQLTWVTHRILLSFAFPETVSQFISQPSFRFRSSVLRNTPWMIYTLTLGSLLKKTNTQNMQNPTAIRSRQPRISWPWQPWTVTTWTFTCLQITLDNLAERWVCNKTASQFLHENDIRLTSVTQCKRFIYQLYYK